MRRKKVIKRKQKYEELGTFLKESRKAVGLTQKEVSTKLGYSTSQFISNFERGACLPPNKKLPALTRIYKVDRQEIKDRIMALRELELDKALYGKVGRSGKKVEHSFSASKHQK
jgi:transcriptional regulator with XRE-family HTH domain